MSNHDLFSLSGNAAAVVGGGGVLAGAMAEGLAGAGADVAILDYNQEAAEARAAVIAKNTGRRAIAIQTDATQKSHLQRALQEMLGAFGRVDILVNAAGINSGTPFFEIEETEGVIAAFLEDHHDFEIESASRFVAGPLVDSGGAMLILPDSYGTDGLYAVRLRRAG